MGTRAALVAHVAAVPLLPPDDIQRMALDSATGRLFVANGRVLDARTGAVIAAFPGGGGSMAVDERTGRVYALDGQGVRILDGHSGAVLRAVAFPPGSNPLHLVVSARTGRVFVKLDTGIGMLDARTGRLLLTRPIGKARFAQLVLDESSGRVFVVDPDRSTVSTLDACSGALLNTVSVGPAPLPTAVDARHERLFVLGQASVSVLDARSGALIRTVAVGPNPSAVAVDERSGRVFISSEGPTDGSGVAGMMGQSLGYFVGPGSGYPLGLGHVSVLDARDGTLLRTMTVGVDPGAMAVDERVGRVYVVNMGGLVHVSDGWGWVPSWLRRRLPMLSQPPSAVLPAPSSVSMLDATR